MKTSWKRGAALGAAACLGAGVLGGCAQKNAAPPPDTAEHEPLTILTAGMDYANFEALLHERYPDIRLEYISYTGGNATGYTQYLLENGDIPDLYAVSVFSQQERQKEYLLDLSGYPFVNNYKTADINQVTLDGAVYMVPASLTIIGLYYNKTLFAEQGWAVPQNLEELEALVPRIREAGLDPVHAQFELSGNGFFDLFTMAKTDYLSTPEGQQWERDFQAGTATAQQGLADAAALVQELIDTGLLDKEDTQRDTAKTRESFENREAAMYLNAGSIAKFTQNEDGTGDVYGLMPFFGKGAEDTVLITLPLRYLGLSKTLGEPGNEQKLADALQVMELLATEEGQQSLLPLNGNYVAPLKNTVIPADSPFAEVEEYLRSGHTSTLAYAGYEPIIIPVGDKVRDWVAGECTGGDVLALMDTLQAEILNNTAAPMATAAEDFTLQQTAQLQAEAFRQAAGTDLGMVSMGGYHDGYQNYSGVCGRLYHGDISEEIMNAIVPSHYRDPVCVLTLTGAQIRAMLDTGYVTAEGIEGFTYVPSGIIVTKNKDGTVRKITMADGSAFDEAAAYTLAIDEGSYTEEVAQAGAVQKTELIVVEVVGSYCTANSPLAPAEASLQ